MQPDEQPLSIRHAGCDCGQLRFAVRGDPIHVHACACSMCRRSSGSVMSYSAWFPRQAVEIHGDFTIHHHKGPEHPDRFRGFCPVCGTGRFFQSGASFPETLAFAAGLFSDPDFPSPSAILYWDDRLAWLGEPVDMVIHAEGDD